MTTLKLTDLKPFRFDTASVTTTSTAIQTFEDRPTVFGERLAINWTVNKYDYEMAIDAKDHLSRVAQSYMRNLDNAIREKCPDCAGCSHLNVELRESMAPHLDESRYTYVAKCDSDRASSQVITCPNGKTAVKRGYKAIVPSESLRGAEVTSMWFDEIGSSAPPAPPPPPPRNPDAPTTSFDEAW